MDKQPKGRIKVRVITIVSLALVWFILMLFADHPNMVERYYSNGFYRVVCFILHPLFNLFPFSVGDLVYIVVICYLIYAFIRLIALLVKRKFSIAGIFLLRIIICIQSAVIIFYLFWGLNYFRPSAAERLKLVDTGFSVTDLRTVTTLLIDSANACRARVSNSDLQQDNQAIFKTALQAIDTLALTSPNFRTFSPRVKPSLLTPLLNYIGTSGYYNPFTSEAQMNYQMPVFVRPFVACHEMSHQMGYGPEDEANFVGFLAGVGSHDRLLRYSAYYQGVEEFMFALRQQDSLARKELKKRISPAVLADFKTERSYWLLYEGKLNAISGLFYDNFLKANNQPHGLKTYNRIVLLVMGWYRKNGILSEVHSQ